MRLFYDSNSNGVWKPKVMQVGLQWCHTPANPIFFDDCDKKVTPAIVESECEAYGALVRIALGQIRQLFLNPEMMLRLEAQASTHNYYEL